MSNPEDPTKAHGREVEGPGKEGARFSQEATRSIKSSMPQIGGYRFIRRLGAGGMGTVFLAEQLSLNRRVAIKFNESRFQETSREQRLRFVREGRAMARVKHPNLAEIHELDGDATPQYLVMEYVEGRTLNQRLRDRPALTESEALEVLRQCVAGLDAVWSANIAHRDVKPDNILLTESGQVKVVDFGLARSEDPAGGHTVTETGSLVGTLLYMAPERIHGERGDGRSDIYALGLVLFKMLTGKDAYGAEIASALLFRHISQALPDARAFNPEVSLGAQRLMEAMTAKDPKGRPGAAELFERIAAIGSEPRIPVRRSGSAGRGEVLGPRFRWSRRGLITVAAPLAVAALAFGVWDGWRWARGRAARVIAITSFPPSAEVLVDGTSLGTTPLESKELAKGDRVLIRKPGYLSLERAIDPLEARLVFRLSLAPPVLSSPPTEPELLAAWRSLASGALAVSAERVAEDGANGYVIIDGSPFPLIRVRTTRPIFGLLVAVLDDGEMRQLAPAEFSPGEALLPIAPGVRELPAGELERRFDVAEGLARPLHLFLFATSSPLELPIPRGAMEGPASLSYPRSVGAGERAFYPGKELIENLVESLNSATDLEWDLVEIATGPL